MKALRSTAGAWIGSLILLTSPACSNSAPEAQATNMVYTAASAKPADIVARVDGLPVLRQDLLEQMRPGQQGRGEALESVIAEHLLLKEAVRQRLQARPAVVREQRRALANLWVTRHFVTGFTKADIPREFVEKSYEVNRSRYVHPNLAEVVHIIVPAEQNQSAEHHRKAKRLIRKAREIALSGKLTPEEFADIPTLLRDEAEGIEIASEPFTAARGYAAHTFVDACEKLSRPGQISPIVLTGYGYHVIYFKSRRPARKVSLSQAEAEIRDRTFDEVRTILLNRRIDQLARDTVAFNRQALTQAFADRDR